MTKCASKRASRVRSNGDRFHMRVAYHAEIQSSIALLREAARAAKIQTETPPLGLMDCFASLAMTARYTPPPSRGALAPGLCIFLRLEKQRAQGKPGARCTRSLAWCVKNTRVSHHRFTGTPGLPCAMVLTAYFALSPVTGLSCHRRPQEACKKLASRELDASVGASGPHDFAVRISAVRPRKMFVLRRCRVHRIPHQRP
jgi:hypothetical protein